MGKLLQLQLIVFLLVLCVASSRCQCPLLVSSANPGEGLIISYSDPSRVENTVASYTVCNVGLSLSTVGSVDDLNRVCQGDGTWTGEDPSCTLLLCLTSDLGVDNVPNLNTTFSTMPRMDPVSGETGYVSTTSATYACDEGFVFSGSNGDICRGDVTDGNLTSVTWISQRDQICRLPCPDLLPDDTLVDRGLLQLITYTNERAVGGTARYRCIPGFFPNGSLERTCLNGTLRDDRPMWSEPEPMCIQQCPALQPIPNGVITYDPDMIADFDVGTVANHTCNEGYLLIGGPRTCLPGGTWSGLIPVCQRLCPALEPIPNGVLTYGPTFTPSSAAYFDQGTLALYTCNAGFMLVGSESQLCLAGGIWSGQPPVCQPMCPPLPMFPNGMITYSTGPLLTFPVGTEAVYQCNAPEGYCLPAGATLRECQPSGTWSGAAPELCGRISCAFLFIINGVVSYSDRPSIQDGTTANQTCQEGFELRGSSNRTCNGVSQTPVICEEFMGNWTGQDGMCVGNFVNDTAIGDPLMTVPLNIADKTSFFEASINNNIGPNDIINLCYELHGRRDAFVNLVSDECISVNAHYELVQPNEPREDINIIDNIHVRATDSIGECRNIGVALNEGGVCTASVDGANIADMYQANGISIRRYTNRVRIMVPNCEDVNLVMWVFCRQSTFWSTFRTDNNGAELTFQADMIKFVIARGFNLRERSHGIIGQFWNIPILVEPFTGSIRSSTPVSTDNLYQVTVEHPNERREFTAWLYPLTWEYRREYCLYAGNQQAGPVYEVESPNDPVIEGTYADYIVDTAYGTDFAFTHFNEGRCNSVVLG